MRQREHNKILTQTSAAIFAGRDLRRQIKAELREMKIDIFKRVISRSELRQ